MSTPIPIFMAPSAPPAANPSNLQPVESQTLEKYMTSVPNMEKGTSLKLPSITPADSFYQTSQHIKISENQAISNKSSLPEGLNIKEIICKLGLMWSCTYANHHRKKPLLQPFSTEGCPVNCGTLWSTDHIEAAILHRPRMSAKSIYSRTDVRSEAHAKVQNRSAKILKYKTIKDRLPPTLKVSPAACIPH